jgi:hypothetical protein
MTMSCYVALADLVAVIQPVLRSRSSWCVQVVMMGGE